MNISYAPTSKHKEYFFHIIFWVIYYLYPLIKFAKHPWFEFNAIEYLYNLLFVLISVYSTLFLFNKFTKNKKGLFLAFPILLVAVCAKCLLHRINCNCNINVCLFNTFMEYSFINILFLNIQIFKKNILHEQALLKTEEERIKTELNALKAQINPHFLFNTLNMLYANAILNDNNLPRRILQLSDNLHYMLHEGGRDQVKMKKELEFIRDYIGLQNARTGKKNIVDFKFSIDNLNQLLPPLLLLPFIENAFKHSNMTRGKQLPIKIFIQLENESLLFSVENRYDQQNISPYNKIWKKSGIGLKNTQRRLEILFPGKHHLLVKPINNIYKVEVKIDLS